MEEKRQAEEEEAAAKVDQSSDSSEPNNGNGRGRKEQSRHSAYRQSQNFSQRPGSFLRRQNGQNGKSRGGLKGTSGQEGVTGAPPSGNRPINPFRSGVQYDLHRIYHMSLASNPTFAIALVGLDEQCHKKLD